MLVLNALCIRQVVLLLTFILLILFIASRAHARAEEVYVAKVMNDDDNAIIVRGNGEAHLIEKGVGCLSLWRYEGKRVLIISPGIFLGIGSRLLIPEAGQECRIWDSKELGTWSGFVPRLPTMPKVTATSQTIQYVQLALNLLNYNPGPPDGLLGTKTSDAIKAFQQNKGITPTGELSSQTYLALGMAVYQARPIDPEALRLAINLLTLAKGAQIGRRQYRTTGCEEGHWISSISSGGEIVILEDRSVWQVDSVDTIDTSLWLPTEDIIICGNTMINVDNGEKVGVSRLR